MKKILLTAAALTAISTSLIGATVEAGNPAGRAVKLLYAAPNSVQRAVYRDACLHWDMLAEHKTARARLSRDHAKIYDAIGSALGNAYAASAGTDSALEQVNAAFCAAADNR